MTEVEWLSATDPTPMLEFLRGKASERKLRLFAVACCRASWDDLTLKAVRRAVEVAEQYADGAAPKEDLGRANEQASTALARMMQRNDGRTDAAYRIKVRRLNRAANAAYPSPFQIGLLGRLAEDEVLEPIIPFLLRCIFNPFHPMYRFAQVVTGACGSPGSLCEPIRRV